MKPLLAAASALTLAAAGCGSSPHNTAGPVTTAKLIQAVTTTRQLRSAHLVERDFTRTSSVTARVVIVTDRNFGASEAMTTATFASIRGRSVIRGDTIWMTDTSHLSQHSLSAGKEWVTASYSRLTHAGGGIPRTLQTPLAILDTLRGVTELKATAPGAATFRCSLTKTLAITPRSRRGALVDAIAGYYGRDVQATGSVALTAAGTVRSETLRIDGRGQYAGVHLRTSLVLTKPNERVTTTPPPSTTVVPLDQVPALAGDAFFQLLE